MVSWLIGVAGSALNFLLGGSGNIANTDIRDAFQGLWGGLQGITGFLQNVMGHEHSAWVHAEPDIITGAWGLGETADANAVAWQRLLTWILPRSLSWLDGHTHQWVDAKYDPFVNRVTQAFSIVWTAFADIFRWIKYVGEPTAVQWTGWHTWFKTWPRDILYRWKYWFADPRGFGQWAAPPVARPLYNYLQLPDRRILRDQYSAMFADEWPNVWRHVEQGLVGVMMTEVG